MADDRRVAETRAGLGAGTDESARATRAVQVPVWPKRGEPPARFARGALLAPRSARVSAPASTRRGRGSSTRHTMPLGSRPVSRMGEGM